MESNHKVNIEVPKMGSSSCSLKRKRPPKLEIPEVLREICTETKLGECETVFFNALEVGVFSRKGKKTFMEDTHKIVSFPQSKKGFFGVYDGHGGSKAAEFVAEHLDSNIYQMLENCSGNETKEEAVKAGYLKTDEEFLKQGLSSGACCVTALVEEKHILVSNLGDCRAVLCKGGVAEALTKDHRAGADEERRRIQDRGGYVDVHRGAWRVHGVLAVSRSIGDAHLKNWVSAEPDTKSIRLTPDMEYLVLASDGLWEKVGNQEAVNIVMKSHSQIKRGQENSDALCRRSPLTRSRRVSIVKCQRTGCSPGSKNIVAPQTYREEHGLCKNDSPPSKIQRVSETGQRNLNLQSPMKENNDLDAILTHGIDQTRMNIHSPQAKIYGKSPQVKLNFHSPNKENSEFKVQCSSEMSSEKLNMQSPTTEICEKSPMGGLVAACKELANLAVSRGSLDDITIIVVDLNQFR